MLAKNKSRSGARLNLKMLPNALRGELKPLRSRITKNTLTIAHYEHCQISHRNKGYRIKISFKSGVPRMSNWGVFILIIDYKQSQTIKLNNNEMGSWYVIDYRLI